MRRNPRAIRARSWSLGAVPTASRASSGSETAATEVPNRLIGSTWMSWAYTRLETPPSPASEPRNVSTRDESWATPAPSTSGAQATSTSRTPTGAQHQRGPGDERVPHPRRRGAEAQRNAVEQPPARRELHGDLQHAARHRPPGESEGEA